jgi:very-short-patch-repair endonuclease
VYGPADLEPNLALRSRAAYLWVGCRAVLGGYSAAEPLSAGCAPVDAPAELMLAGAHLRAPSGVMVHQTKVAGEEHVEYGDLVLTTPVRTAYDLGRCPLDEAVVAVDALSARFGFEPKDVLSFAERYTGARDSFRLPSVIALAEPRTESPMETRLRLVLLRGGLHPPCAQYTVVDQLGHFVARVDFAYPDDLVAIECEGSDHFTDQQVIRDGRRYTRLADLGRRVYRYFARDVYRHPVRRVSEIHRALTVHHQTSSPSALFLP